MHFGSYKGSFLHRLRDSFLKALKLNLFSLNTVWQLGFILDEICDRNQEIDIMEFGIFGTSEKLKILAYWNKMIAQLFIKGLPILIKMDNKDWIYPSSWINLKKNDKMYETTVITYWTEGRSTLISEIRVL